MMWRKKLITLGFTVLIVATGLRSQVQQLPLAGEISGPAGNFIGSPWFYDHWLTGDVLLENGMVARNLKLRYNSLLDQLIWLHEESSQHIRLDRDQVKGFMLYLPESEDTVLFMKVGFPSLRLQGESGIFAQVMFDDIVTLYAVRRVSRKRDVQVKRGRSSFMFTELEPAPVYLLMLPGKETVRLDNIRRRNIYRTFPEIRDGLQQYARQSRRGISDEQRLIETARQLNSILESNRAGR